MSESKLMVYTLSAVLLFMFIHIFNEQILTIYNPNNFLGFHTILEFFSISFSISIFLYGWRMFELSRLRSFLLLASIFYIVGLFDMFHTLTFEGMPYFFTGSSIAKTSWFWMTARITESILMIAFLLLPDQKLPKDFRKIVFLLCNAFFILITYIIYHYENVLPLLIIDGEGTTFLKNVLEYFISFLQLIAIVFTLYRYNTDRKEAYLYYTLAFTFLFLSELIFTIFQSVYDIDNLTGHFYKALGYYFIMKGFLFSSSYEGNHEIELRDEKKDLFV